MKAKNAFPLSLLCAALLCACSQFNTMPDVGTDFNLEDIKKLTVGESTETDVIQLFGKPRSRTAKSDGTVQLTYMFMKAHPSAIDILGNNPGHYETKTMIINLDSNGKLKDYTQSTR